MGAPSAASRFIMPLGDASMMIDTIIAELECDPVCERPYSLEIGKYIFFIWTNLNTMN